MFVTVLIMILKWQYRSALVGELLTCNREPGNCHGAFKNFSNVIFTESREKSTSKNLTNW